MTHFKGYQAPLLLALAALALAGIPCMAATGAEKPKPAPENAIVHVHDPEIIKEGPWYYVFSTGPGIMVRRSRDLVNWTFVGRVFKEDVPAWAIAEIPGAKGLWAPGIARVNGQYYLYYSVSTFGSIRSVIGLAVNKTLDPDRKDFGWVDRGKVVESWLGGDFNAIDPALASADKGRWVLTFGSHWSGIKMVDIDPGTGKPRAGSELRAIAGRPAPGAIEAPYILKRGRYYYLFVSFDACCRGKDSTYNIRVGRADRVDGPYADREGRPMVEGGGTPLLATEGRAIGPGHCSVLSSGGRYHLAYHMYDGEANGVPTLQIRPMRFDRDGWPVLDAPLDQKAP